MATQIDPSELRDHEAQVSDALKAAASRGATQAEAAVTSSSGLSVTVRMGQLETVEHDRGSSLTVRVYFDKRMGAASTSDLSPRALRTTVDAACDIARHTGADACHGLADPDLMASTIPDLDLHHPWNVGIEEAVALARTCEEEARARDPRIDNSEGATLSSHSGGRVYGNSHGFLGSYSSSRHSLSCAVIATGEDGSMERDSWFTVARDPARMESAPEVGRRAGERTARRIGARRLATGKYPVVYRADVAGGLFGHFLGAVSGGNLYRGTSFLADSLGRSLFPGGFLIQDAPHIKGALASAPFDREGVATSQRPLVEDGRVRGYLLDSYAACRLGTRTTGNAGGPHNVLVEQGGEDLGQLLARMGDGLLITEVMGMGVNLLTGDYSRGARGFWVEDGVVAYPVHEITVAGRLQDMFREIQAVGGDVDRRRAVQTGSVLIDSMTVAGA